MLLDLRERLNLAGLEASARDGEVFDGTLRLRAVQRALRHAHLAHGVVLDAVLGVCGLAHRDGSVSLVVLRRDGGSSWESGCALQRANGRIDLHAAVMQAVVRSDDREAAGGDGLADQFAGAEQRTDGIAQVLTADFERIDGVDGG